MTEETSPTPPKAAASPPSGDLADGATPPAPADPADQTSAAKPPSGSPPPDADPSGGTPPPFTSSTDQRGAWAAQFGLVRPRHGGMLAGVCAGLGRATNTDAVLWRVLLAVLTCLFGFGLLVYIVLWLIMPREGDTASPIEALFGRGRSSTGSVLTIVLAVGVFFIVGTVTDRFPFLLIVALGLIIAALLANRSHRARPQGDGGAPPSFAYPPSDAPPAGYPAPVYPPAPGAPQVPGYPSGPPTYPAGYPGSTVTAQLPAATEPPGYRPPFAPHGPFAAPPPPLPAPPPPKRKPEPSRLGRLTMGLLLLAIGCLGLFDLSGTSVPFSAYVATGLAITGLGLLIGAWLGRARGLIALGIVASVLLAMTAAGESWEDTRGQGTEYYDVLSFDELKDRYEFQLGQATLDLRQLDFAGQDREVTVDISIGSFKVLLPPNVDVTVETEVNAGSAVVFGREFNGASASNTQIDNGADGPGGGTLRINLEVNVADAEVTR